MVEIDTTAMCVYLEGIDYEVWIPAEEYPEGAHEGVAAILEHAGRVTMPKDSRPLVWVERWPNVLADYRSKYGWADA